MSAVISDTANNFYIMHPPFNKLKEQKCLETLPKYKLSKALHMSELKENIETHVLLQALVLMHDFFIKINEGSIDIVDDLHFKELIIKKLLNNSFIFEGETQQTLIQWLNITFIAINYSKEDIVELIDELEENNIKTGLLKKMYNLQWWPDKYSLVNRLLDVELEKMKGKSKWQMMRKVTFVIMFMANNYNNSRITDAKEAFKEATEDFERETGMDANYSRFKRTTDRSSSYRHQAETKRKLSNDT